MMYDVPQQHTSAYARVMVEILTYIRCATDDEQLTRGLKWYLAIDAILLRVQDRGGSRGAGEVDARFAAWREGDLHHLIRWWCQATNAAWSRRERRSSHIATEADTVRHALRLVRDGEVGRGLSMLHSLGIHSVSDPVVLEQLRSRQPERRRPFPGGTPGDQSEFRVQLGLIFRRLRRRAGVGPTGRRNEYLRALASRHSDRMADTVIPEYEGFAARVLGGSLPRWFYLAWSCARLIPIRRQPKPGRTAAQTPPRPIAIGETDRRAIERAAMDTLRPYFLDYLAPQQLAVGVDGGASILIHGARLSVATRRSRVLVSLDMTDAYQTIDRDIVLTRLLAVPGLTQLATYFHAVHGPQSYLFVGPMMQRLFGDVTSRGDSAEGVQQGGGISGGCFCVGIQPEVRAFDHTLAAHDGWARFWMDDGFAHGESQHVFPAVVTFIRAVRALGLVIGSASCYSPDYDLESCPHRRAAADELGFEISIGGLHIPTEDGPPPTATRFRRGVMVMGVPVGEQEFEQHVLSVKAGKAVSQVDTTISRLQSHLASHSYLHSFTFLCLAPIFDYRLAHASSPDLTRDATARFDAALSRAVAGASSDAVVSDPLLLRRSRLPVRERGLGVRSRAQLADTMWCASFIRACETFLDRGDGAHHSPGFFPCLTELFGAGAFESGGHRFSTFLASGLSSADVYASAWSRVVLAAGNPTDGPLSLAAADAGRDGAASGFQRALTNQIETHQAHLLDADLAQLPPVLIGGKQMQDPRLASWREGCKFGRAFVACHPSATYQPTSPEFQEMVCTYLGAPSPLARRLGVGRVVRDMSGARRRSVTLDAWGFALTMVTATGDDWRRHHDAIAGIMFSDAKRAGIEGSTEVSGLFTDLLPSGVGHTWRRKRRDGLVPDARLRRDIGGSGFVDHLHDVKAIHYCPTRYPLAAAEARGQQRGDATRRRADLVAAEYDASARRLDARFHSAIADPAGRPVLQRLRSYPPPTGLCVGAFAEASPGIHLLLRDVAQTASVRHWREAGASSPDAALSTYTSIYRQRWGCEFALQGARLRIARQHLVAGAAPCDEAAAAPSAGFHPGDRAAFARAATRAELGCPAHRCGAGGSF